MILFGNQFSDLILKPIDGDSLVCEDDKQYVFYSNKISSITLEDIPEDAFSQTACFLQNYIEKEYEVRVTVVENNVFACKIDSQAMKDNQGRIDWRQGYDYNIKHEIITLPNDIEVKCLDFLKIMGLNVGAFYFIVTPDNKYIFLECNPNGQWLWIELLTGQKISEKIANALDRRITV